MISRCVLAEAQCGSSSDDDAEKTLIITIGKLGSVFFSVFKSLYYHHLYHNAVECLILIGQNRLINSVDKHMAYCFLISLKM